MYFDDGNIVGVGAAYNETWEVTASGVATQEKTKQIYVNASSVAISGITFSAYIKAGNAAVRITPTTATAKGTSVSLSSLRVVA
jgi:hypothetical protein